MGDAAALAEVLQRLVTPAPPREWMPLDVEAKARGKTTSALREWCERNGVQIRQQNHRDAWVRPADIDAAVERMRPAALQLPELYLAPFDGGRGWCPKLAGRDQIERDT